MAADHAELFFTREQDQLDLEAVLENLQRDKALHYEVHENYEESPGVKGRLYKVYAEDPMTYYQLGMLHAHLMKIRSAVKKDWQ